MKKLKHIILAILTVLILLPKDSIAQQGKYQALFLYNFTKYMKWPDKSKITIGVMGDSQVIPELQNIAGRGSSSKINIIKIEEKGDVTKCDMIFLPETESKSFDMIQDVIGDKNIVVVAENSKLAKKGAEVGFFLENSKMKFIINKDELEATEVRVSQGLYSIAKII